MYAWIFRHLPGPLWLRIMESLVLIAAIVWVLFTYVYPWAQDFFGLGAAASVR
ncbi:hypothetical protein [Schaalia sp. ZJ1691]|nr:hypothetical protein [Schaalia sp. ZJ1691]